MPDMLRQSNQELLAMMSGSANGETGISLPPEIMPGHHLIWLSPSSTFFPEFGYDFEDQAVAVAAYRQISSRQSHDYVITVVPLSNGSRFALPFGDNDF
jgi:hypothetical protein